MTSYFRVTGGTRLAFVIRAPHSRSSVMKSNPSLGVKYPFPFDSLVRLSKRTSWSLSVPEVELSPSLLPSSEDLSRSSDVSLSESIDFLFNFDKRLLSSLSEAYCPLSKPPCMSSLLYFLSVTNLFFLYLEELEHNAKGKSFPHNFKSASLSFTYLELSSNLVAS
ncbi:histone-lysine N-methyltransferase ATXR3 [Trifolium repens]|nr:histone-lysine N-methyltransferase ATXR3 [Trifolium repens]